MKSLFTKKAHNIIGLDIGTRYIKAVSLAVQGDTTKVTGFACEPITGAAFNEREVKDFDAVSKALKKVKLALKSKHKTVAIAVAGSSVLSKTIFMEPNQTDFELESQIELEADSLIPYPIEEVYIDFEQIPESQDQLGKVGILLSAAHKDIVDSRLTLVREVAFDPVIADIESYALANAMKHFADSSDEEPICCINVGASLVQLSVLQNGKVLYSKEHSFGSQKLLQDLALVHNLDTQEVEATIARGEMPPAWVNDTLPLFIGSLQQHIQRALQLYTNSTHKTLPKRIMLAGGVASLPGLLEELSEELNLEVLAFNPFLNVAVDDKLNTQKLHAMAPQLAIAMGLASRSYSSWHI